MNVMNYLNQCAAIQCDSMILVIIQLKNLRSNCTRAIEDFVSISKALDFWDFPLPFVRSSRFHFNEKLTFIEYMFGTGIMYSSKAVVLSYRSCMDLINKFQDLSTFSHVPTNDNNNDMSGYI